MALHARIALRAAAVAAACACAPADEPAHRAEIVLADIGLATPESVLHDPAADVYLVSNINGNPLEKDDNGFIARITPEGEVDQLHWIDGAAPDVTLHAPKGMAIIGDTLFVTDIDVVRLFHRTRGTPLGQRAVPGATFLNDLAVGPDATLYVTDSGYRSGTGGFEDSGTDALYRFDASGTARAVLAGPGLGRPNGIAADSAGVTLVTFGSGTMVRVDPADGRRTDLPMPAQGQLDGVVLLPDGTLLVSSWGAQAVYRLSSAGEFSVLVDSVSSPADIGYDAVRGRVLIPVFTEDRVMIRDVER